MSRARLLLLSSLPLFAASCGGGDKPAKQSAPTKVTIETPTPDPGAEAGEPGDTTPGDALPAKVRGEVLFVGEPPARKELAFGGEPGCNIEAGTIPLSETVLVNDGRVENCIVYVSKGLPRNYEAPPAPEETIEFTQEGCVYKPHVSAARAGQTLVFHNKDGASHNVRIASKYQGFNKTQPANGQAIEYLLERAEPPIRIGCDIHTWMRAWVGAFSHPFFAVTGPDGTFSLEGLPPGSYELVCWHEQLGKKTVKLDLPPGGSAAVEFSYTD